MSRIGKKPILIPSGVSIDILEGAVRVRGGLGELEHSYPDLVKVRLDAGRLLVERDGDTRQHRAFHGLTRVLIANMVTGVSEGYTKVLEIVGYRVQQLGQGINLQVGYTHPVVVQPADGITLAVEGTNRITVRGINKQMVGEMAAYIRRVRPPDAYKGKGIRYLGELIRLKPGKAAGRK
jgi:large subunit ribosomal protein L6